MSYSSQIKIATISEAKNALSALIDLVRGGETVLIVDRGRPVARLESAVSAGADDLDGRLLRLERTGVVRVGLDRPPVELIRKKPPRPRPGASALSALLEERRRGR